MAAATKLYNERTITDWKDLHEFAASLQKYVFRGHSQTGWKLSSSYVRECERLPVTLNLKINIECQMLREFKRRAHLYERVLPDLDDHVGWLALMQHYGAPTRMVDFTYSLYVACFFALIASEGDSEIWAINDMWLRDRVERHTRFGSEQSPLRHGELEAQRLAANGFLSGCHDDFEGGGEGSAKLPLGVFMIDPHRQSERLGNQQGLFLMQMNLERTFLENLFDQSHLPENVGDELVAGTRENVLRIVLSKKLRHRGLEALRAMNVTSETLFPGLEGYARSIMHSVVGG